MREMESEVGRREGGVRRWGGVRLEKGKGWGREGVYN